MGRKSIIFVIGICILIVATYFIYVQWGKRNAPLTLYGNVDIRDVNTSFRVSGRLMNLYFDEGDEIHRGVLLARLDPEPYQNDINSAAATVDQQKAALAYAETVLAREKKMLGTGASSIDHYKNAISSHDQAQANLEKANADLAQAQLRLRDTYLYSPSDGQVLTRVVEPGTMLAVSDTVLDITLVNPVWVRAYVSEINLGKAKPGTKVKVTTDSNPKKSYEGEIGFVSPTAEFTPKTVETPDLRTELVYRLRIIMQDPHHELRQGMPVTVVVQNQKRA